MQLDEFLATLALQEVLPETEGRFSSLEFRRIKELFLHAKPIFQEWGRATLFNRAVLSLAQRFPHRWNFHKAILDLTI